MNSQKLITKYTDAEGIEFIRSGSFLVGTLSSYGKQERKEQLRGPLSSDETEGLDEVKFCHGDGYFEINTDEIKASGWAFNNVENASTINTMYDRWIFCATKGDYDEQHHRDVILPKRREYTAYAVLDIDKFALALLKQAHSELPDKVSVIYHDDVIYTKAPLSVGQVSINKALSREETARRCSDSIIFKPESFAAEKEYRFMLAPHIGGYFDAIYEPRAFQSEELRQSIVTTGSIRN